MSPAENEEGRTPSISEQRAYWNEWNAKYREREQLPHDARARGEAVMGHVRSFGLESPRILEVGCATGWLCELLSEVGEVTGTDLADDVIAEAKANVPGVRFVAGDFLELDFGPEPFDVIVSLETIAHVRDRRAFCDKLASLLVDRGHLVITAQNRFIWELSGVLNRPSEILLNLLTMTELKALLQPRFEVLAAGTVIPFGHAGFMRIVNSTRLNRVLKRLLGAHRVRRVKERLGLGNTLVVAARKR